MCLVAFSWKNHSKFPLIIRANRDEFFKRPTQKIHLWESGFYGGKDLKSGGTWLGVNPNGRWSLLTNYRDFNQSRKAEISRGKLVQNFLESTKHPFSFLEGIRANQEKYDGFNLLVSDADQLFYYSNFGENIEEVKPGVHGLSNGLLDEPWPKVELAKAQMKEKLESHLLPDDLFEILNSTSTFPLETLPNTGVSKEMEIGLSPQFIRLGEDYGTVSSTLVLLDEFGKVTLKERTFQPDYRKFTDEKIEFGLIKPIKNHD